MLYGILGIAILLMWLVFTSRRFRWAMLASLILAAVASGLWALGEMLPEGDEKKNFAIASDPPWPTEIIAADQLWFTNVSLKKVRDRDGYYEFAGSITNNASSALLSFVIAITVTKCRSYCTTVGERTVSIVKRIAPGETKSFENKWVRLTGIPSGISWTYRVISTYAEKSPPVLVSGGGI